jgi:hypothetical protein
MAAKGSKRGRGRGKGTEAQPVDPGPETPATQEGPDEPVAAEPQAEPATGPETPLPPDDEGSRSDEVRAEAEEAPSVEEREVAEAPEPAEAEAPAPRRQSHGLIAGLAGGLVVAILIGAGLVGVWLFGAADDTDRLDQQAQRLDALATQTETQASRLGAAEEAISGLQSELGQVTAAISQLQNSLSDLQSAAEANRQNLDRMAEGIEDLRATVDVPTDAAAVRELVGELRDAIGSLAERVTGLEREGDLDQLTGGIARLQEEISELRQQAAGRIEQVESATALGRAYAALTARIAAGAPFAEELEAVTAELPSAPGLETLRPLAGAGVATMSDLRARLAAISADVAREVPDEPEDADGLWQTMRQRLEGMVTVRRADEADWPAVLERADEALQRGDIEAAIAQVEQVSDAAPDEIAAWLVDAQARRDAEAALDELSDAVLRQFAGRR